MMLKLTTAIDSENPTVGDLHLDNGRIAFLETESVEHIGQRIYQRLSFFRGEWYLDQLQGFPYFQKILKKNPNLDQIAAMYRRTILEVPGVAHITYFSTDFDKTTRTYTIDFSCKSDTGAVVPTVEPFIVRL